MHVRGLPGDGHRKFTVFLFDTLCCGSSAYWSIKELLASLGIQRDASYIRHHSQSWYRAGLQYELDDLETTCRGDANVMKHTPGCTEMVILLLARWSFRQRVAGGFKHEADRSACEAFLRTLCKALHEGHTMKMPFCLHRVVRRHECETSVGEHVVTISVQQDGIVDLSELRARAQDKNRVAQVWVKHLDLQFGCKDFDLVDLLRWSETSAYPHMLRKTFPMQVVWNIGRALEQFILVNLSAEGVGEVSGIRLECEVSPSARHLCFLPLAGCQQASVVAPSSSTPLSTHVLMESPQQDAFMKQDVRRRQSMWKRLSDNLVVVRNSLQTEEPVVELSDFLSKYRAAILHVRGLPGGSHHKFTVFLFNALCCGSSAYWSIKEMLASLGIERSSNYIGHHSKAWYRAGLEYELRDLETTGRGDTTVMKHKPGCTELVILLLARWSFRHRNSGGFSHPKDRSASASFLRTLCKALHENQTIKLPFCLHRFVKRHECGSILGKDVVFISVHKDGIVDLSELRARAQNNNVARLWLKHLDMKFGCENFDLVDLLRWSVTSAFPAVRRKTFPMQVVWNIGCALEQFILVNLSAEGVGEVSGLRLECEVSPNARHLGLLPVPGCQTASAVAGSSSSPYSTQMLLEKAQQDAFMQKGVNPQHTTKDQALRRGSTVKQIMKSRATRQVPLSMQRQAGNNAPKRPAKRPRQATSVPKQNSEKKARDRPGKKRARHRSESLCSKTCV